MPSKALEARKRQFGRGSAAAWRVVAWALAACSAPSTAWAGAWTLAKEQDIWTVAGGGAGSDEAYEASLYWEHPVNQRLALVAAPWVQNRPGREIDAWRGEAVLAIKTPLDSEGRAVSALQAGLVIRSDVRGCSIAGAEVRWLGGVSFPNARQAFFNVEAAARAHGGGCAEGRLDLTAGYRPQENWLALGQVFADLPQAGEQSVKLQFSLVRFPAGGGSGVQIGLRAPVDRHDGDAPLSLVLALWR